MTADETDSPGELWFEWVDAWTWTADEKGPARVSPPEPAPRSTLGSLPPVRTTPTG